ncbi:hypothetical protein F4775DRAFT_481381 [Biscogniauxia sp. FL1348]|nr:hypothetical protein F4775DRAFT_481381 [Biscogniauxia sp. FL1348]
MVLKPVWSSADALSLFLFFYSLLSFLPFCFSFSFSFLLPLPSSFFIWVQGLLGTGVRRKGEKGRKKKRCQCTQKKKDREGKKT